MAERSFDNWMAEVPSHLVVPASALATWSPEKTYDVRWAVTIVEHALRRLREECESRGRRRVFEIASPYLSSEREDVHYTELAKSLGTSVETVRNLLHRLRSRYRELLREEVAETVADPAELDDEVRYLCSVLAATE